MPSCLSSILMYNTWYPRITPFCSRSSGGRHWTRTAVELTASSLTLRGSPGTETRTVTCSTVSLLTDHQRLYVDEYSLSYGFMSHPTQNRSFWRRSFQPISWLSTEKLKQTQQKPTRIHHKIYYNIKLTQKTKATFGWLLRLPAWKQNGSILEKV